jgi:glycosyltransferase involved in cell wall biosynthesis
MANAPAVSVIMANYNGARFLRAAVQSVLQQTLQSWELILVDDSSTDESIAVAEHAADGDPRVRIIKQEVNRGPGAARNRGLELARGEWVAVLDSDDLMTPERLQVLRDSAMKDQAALVADNQIMFSESDSKRRLLRNHLGWSAHWIGLAEFIESSRLYSLTPDLGYLKPMIRTEIIRRLDLRYDERLRIGEDYHFLARILKDGHRLRLYPLPMYLYRRHASSVSHRMRAADIRALIDADDRYFSQASLPPRERSALRQRRHMLDSLLVFEDVVQAAKAGDARRATAILLLHPFIWPLLSRPIMPRLKRLLRSLVPKADRRRSEFGAEHGHARRPR